MSYAIQPDNHAEEPGRLLDRWPLMNRVQRSKPSGNRTIHEMEPLEPRVFLNATIFSDGFESGFPGSWVVGTDSGGMTTTIWGDNTASAYAGTKSAFCADNGSDTRNVYDNNVHTYMERRNISLSGYTLATLSFRYWLNTEATNDYFTVNLRDQTGVWHELMRDSGNDSALGWQSASLNLATYAGQSGLYIQFRFDSNNSVVSAAPSGAWVDHVSLTANNRPNQPTFVSVPSSAKLYPYTYSDSPDDTNGPYTVVVDYTDPDGAADIQNAYLRLTGGGPVQTLMYSNMTTVSRWASEEDDLYNFSATKTAITNGYRVTWSFQVKNNWYPSTNVDFSAWSYDYGASTSTTRMHDWNGIYDNNLFISDARKLNMVDLDGDGYYSSVRIEADTNTSVASRSVKMILYRRDSAVGGSGASVWNTGNYTTSGSSTDWTGTDITVSTAGVYDFGWELYDPTWYISSLGYDLDADISNIQMEAANQDIPPTAPDQPTFISIPSYPRLYPYTYSSSPHDTNGPYIVVVDYTDPNGAADIQNAYLRLTGGGPVQTLMYSNMTTVSRWASEEDDLYNFSATKTAITNGYRVTWSFQVKNNWYPSTNVDFSAWAYDRTARTSSTRTYDWNGIYDNNLSISDARKLNMVDLDGDGYYSSVRIEADANTSVASRSVKMILYRRDSAVGGSGISVWDTGNYTTSGSSTDWTGTGITVSTTGVYDFGWELYDPTWYIGNRWYDVDSDISNIQMEPLNQDLAAGSHEEEFQNLDSWYLRLPNGSIAATADQGNTVAKLTFPGTPSGSPWPLSGPAYGPEIIDTRGVYQYGTFTARLKAGQAMAAQNEGTVTGFFTYWDEGTDVNSNGKIDSSEIDVELLGADPYAVWLNVWTSLVDHQARRIDMRTGVVTDALTNTQVAVLPTENRIADFDAVQNYYTYSFTWTATSVTYYLQTSTKNIELWHLNTPGAIPSHTAKLVFNQWYTSTWARPGQTAPLSPPAADSSLYVDWVDSPDPVPAGQSMSFVVENVALLSYSTDSFSVAESDRDSGESVDNLAKNTFIRKPSNKRKLLRQSTPVAYHPVPITVKSVVSSNLSVTLNPLADAMPTVIR